MWTRLRAFGKDERGCAATDWVFVASILTLGAMAGLFALHHFADKHSDESAIVRMR